MKKILIGEIVGYHGLKGELKIVSSFPYASVVLSKNKLIYLQDEEHTISSLRIHKKNYLITIDELYNLNYVDKYIKNKVYINREDLLVEYLPSELINFTVLSNNEKIGTVKLIKQNINNDFIVLDNNMYIPLIEHFLDSVDMINQKVHIKNFEELSI